MKKLLLTLLALLMCITLAACTRTEKELTPAERRIKDDAEIKKNLGFLKYDELYHAADKITDDLDARYHAFAKADAYLVDKVLFIPSSQQLRSMVVSKIVPFSGQYAPTGLAELKYKNMRVQKDIVTAAEYADAFAKFEAGHGLPVAPAKADYTGPKELVLGTSREVQSLDYTITALEPDHEINANLVEGLLQNDEYGNFVAGIADFPEVSADGLTYTFHIHPGVKWSTINGEVYADVKAQDFVTGLRHAAEFDSGTSWLLQGVIEGYDEYVTAKDYSDEAFAKVGVKAVDDYTLEYKLVSPAAYFPSMTAYAILFPINEDFLKSKGEGCALGNPNKETCKFGELKNDSILYNGAYFLTTNDAKSQAVLTANPNYWDTDHVYLEKITRIFDEGQDPYSGIKGFEQGTYSSAGLSTSWSDYDKYAEKYKDFARPSLPNSSCFGVVFNFNRMIYENTEHQTDEDKANTKAAILNINFRKALRAAFDKKADLLIDAPEAVAESTIRNINNFGNIVKLSDGTAYGEVVTKAYQEMTKTDIDLADGHDPFFNPDDAKAFIAAAEKDGIKFPVSLDMLVVSTSDGLVKKGQSMKTSIETATDGKIIINLVMRDADTVQAIAFYNNDPAKADYDISTFTGWSPDYADPKSFVDIYSPTTGYYMTSCGLLNNQTIEALKAEAEATQE